MERDPLRDQSLPFHCLDRGHHTRDFGRQPFSEHQDCPHGYHVWSSSGGDAMAETFLALTAFRARNPGPLAIAPDYLEARTLVRAKLASIFAIAVRRTIIEDRTQLPRIIEERAIREILEDGFLEAWTATELPPLYFGWGNGDSDGWGTGAWGDPQTDSESWGVSKADMESGAWGAPSADSGSWGWGGAAFNAVTAARAVRTDSSAFTARAGRVGVVAEEWLRKDRGEDQGAVGDELAHLEEAGMSFAMSISLTGAELGECAATGGDKGGMSEGGGRGGGSKSGAESRVRRLARVRALQRRTVYCERDIQSGRTVVLACEDDSSRELQGGSSVAHQQTRFCWRGRPTGSNKLVKLFDDFVVFGSLQPEGVAKDSNPDWYSSES
ncbi:hypothetical protein R3P38DRAFT_2788149 [Favolaschia claudopus]|uniref:Uncharacterized protein n=1 Tax=Favolaschia claudopus TaxID=2862362 RepID=A0AAW0AL26_9AGAR